MTELFDEYRKWLESQCFNTFGTFTFGKWVPSPEKALQIWRKMGQAHIRGAPWFAVVEKGKLYGRVHLHALFRPRFPIHAEFLVQIWRDRYGFARVELIESGAHGYCVKYILKDATQWDFANLESTGYVETFQAAHRVQNEQVQRSLGIMSNPNLSPSAKTHASCPPREDSKQNSSGRFLGHRWNTGVYTALWTGSQE